MIAILKLKFSLMLLQFPYVGNQGFFIFQIRIYNETLDNNFIDL